MNTSTSTALSKSPPVCLVFGASGEQGRAVVEGMTDSNVTTFGFTRETHDAYLTDALGATLYTGDVQNPDDVLQALLTTKATCIFFVTTTELPSEVGQTSGCSDAAAAEYQVIVEFFHLLKQAYEQDGIARHVVMSTRDNVQKLNREILEATGDLWIDPLDDGSIVPHYTSKGRGGEYGMEYLKNISNLKLTLLTMPFFYSAFLGFFAPLPDESKTQWQLNACFGDGTNSIDMMGASDLAYIVPNIFAKPDEYEGVNLRLASERISMDAVALEFSDLYGKDVVYNPLSPEEVSALPFPQAPAMAQMFTFLGDPRALRHDLEGTYAAAFPRKPQTFKDWLLTHSDATAFQRVGLTLDSPDIHSVTVFGATSPEGRSVVKGLLNDSRKRYKIRATTRHVNGAAAKQLVALDPSRIEIVFADFDNMESCLAAVNGTEGAFLVTDFYEEAGGDMETEERHARNVIDACEASQTVKHLVFSTFESVEEMNRVFGLGMASPSVAQLDAKARAAAYARTKKLSVTYILMPCYSELFFDRIEKRTSDDGGDKYVLTLPLKNDTKVMCMSIDDLGPAVANVFDSYQVYAGHEIGLVTDFVTISEVKDMINEVFMQGETDETHDSPMRLETEDVTSYLEPRDTYMKDLGQMFAYMAHTDAVKQRHSIAKTMKLVPSALPLRRWIEANVDNVAFREKLGLR
ncbi:NmrA-like domain-containing protein 1 [Mayamaea pseudoterrestris]|nr:NmrA-like domain-containing protein 1 [Mayamaea pseudoterrestris]